MARTDTLGHFLTDIANAIRNKKGSSATITASNFDTEIANLPSASLQSSKSVTITSNGTQTITPDTGYDAIEQVSVTTQVSTDLSQYFTSTISGTTSDTVSGIEQMIKTIPSTTTVSGNSLAYGFSRSKIVTLPIINTANVTDFSNCFYYCSSLTTLPNWNYAKATKMGYICYNCTNLTTLPQTLTFTKVTRADNSFTYCTNLVTVYDIDLPLCTRIDYMFNYDSKLENIGTINLPTCENLTNAFGRCSKLANIGGFTDLGKAYSTTQSANYTNYTLDLSASSVLTRQSMLNIFNSIYDIATKGCNTQKIKVSSTTYGLLSADDIAIATAKGWTVSTS